MKYLILALLIFSSLASFSQDQIILKSGEIIDCKITKVDTATIHYNFISQNTIQSSHVATTNVHSYTFTSNSINNQPDKSESTTPNNTAALTNERTKWTNIISYSRMYGNNANGWALQYYGYLFKSSSKWILPAKLGIEGFTIDEDYFAQFNYNKATLLYFSAGVSPFYQLKNNFYLNLSASFIFGEEILTQKYFPNESHSFYGFAPSQGLYFIPKSKVGLVLGVSAYQKLLTSKVYKKDLGARIELGIKF